MMNSLKEYEDREFANASKEDLKIAGKKDKSKLKALKEAFKDFNKWWTDAIGDRNVDVKLSQRLSTTPCIVVTSKYGWSANMERIMRAQALGDAEKQSYMKAKRFLEINPRHPVVAKLKGMVCRGPLGQGGSCRCFDSCSNRSPPPPQYEANAEDPVARDLAKVLYETSLLESGFPIEDVKGFNGRVRLLLREKMGLGADEDVLLEEDALIVDQEDTQQQEGEEEDAHDEL